MCGTERVKVNVTCETQNQSLRVKWWKHFIRRQALHLRVKRFGIRLRERKRYKSTNLMIKKPVVLRVIRMRSPFWPISLSSSSRQLRREIMKC